MSPVPEPKTYISDELIDETEMNAISRFLRGTAPYIVSARGQMVYAHGDKELRALDAPAAGVHLLSHPGGTEAPAWLPHTNYLTADLITAQGQLLYGSGSKALAPLDAPASGPHILTHPGGTASPAWTPDGAYLRGAVEVGTWSGNPSAGLTATTITIPTGKTWLLFRFGLGPRRYSYGSYGPYHWVKASDFYGLAARTTGSIVPGSAYSGPNPPSDTQYGVIVLAIENVAQTGGLTLRTLAIGRTSSNVLLVAESATTNRTISVLSI